jgi:Tfp pilus assembly PilM family ATPase
VARFLAIDWDQNHLHVISANVGGGTATMQRAVIWEEARTPNPVEAEQLGQLLRDRLKEAKITPAPVLACIGRDRVILKEVRFPPVPDTEEATLVRFQTVKELTDAPEDVVIDYDVVSGPEEAERRALALVVRKEQLELYRTLCEAAGLKLAGLAPRPFGVHACIRKVMGTSVLTPAPEPEGSAVAAVAIGERWAEFCVTRGDRLLLSRALPVGPNLAADIRRNLAVHNGQSPQHPIQAVYVAGKGVAEVRQRLVDLIEIPVHGFDPFAGADTIDVPAVSRGTFAGAAGLLYAWGRAGSLPINFAQPKQPKPVTNPNYRLVRLALVAALVLFVGLGVLGRVLLAGYEDEVDDVEAREKEVSNKLDAAKLHLKRLKGIDDWDAPVWLEEFYNLTARIPDVNALRVTSVSADPLPRTAKTRFAGVLTVRGKLLNSFDARKPLDQLIAELNKSGFYSPGAPKVEKDTFTLRVHIERRAPNEYAEKVVPQEPKKVAGKAPEEKAAKGKGKDRGNRKGKGKGKRRRADPEDEE